MSDVANKLATETGVTGEQAHVRAFTVDAGGAPKELLDSAQLGIDEPLKCIVSLWWDEDVGTQHSLHRVRRQSLRLGSACRRDREAQRRVAGRRHQRPICDQVRKITPTDGAGERVAKVFRAIARQLQ